MPNKTEKIHTDNQIKKSSENLELLDQGNFEAQVENVQNYMKERFEDEYGQDRVAHVMEKLAEFEGLETWFTERQIARLALLDVVDPSYTYEDPNRPNTHFEDFFQMAKFVEKHFEDLKFMGLGLQSSQEVLSYILLNHDLGKAGEDSSTVIAKLFNVKEDGALAKEKNMNVGSPATISEMMILLDLDDKEKDWQAIGRYIGRPNDTADQLGQLPMTRIYNKHESKLSELKLALDENPNFKSTEPARDLLLSLVQSHHNDRNPQVLLDLQKKGYLDEAIFLDILDKTQAFLLRKPKRTVDYTYNTLESMIGNILPEIQDIYRLKLKRLFDTNLGTFDEPSSLARELIKLESER